MRAQNDAPRSVGIRSTQAHINERLGSRIAEADEDDGRSLLREMTENPNHQRPPQRQVSLRLVRVAVSPEAGQRERGVQQQHAGRDPAISKRVWRLQVDRTTLDGHQCVRPLREAAGVIRLPCPGGHDELDHRAPAAYTV